MAYHPRTVSSDHCDSSFESPEFPAMTDSAYALYGFMNPPMLPLTADELALLSRPIYGQGPPRHTTTSTPFVVDSIEHQTPESRSQVSISSPTNGSVNNTQSAKPSIHRSKKKTNCPRSSPRPHSWFCKWLQCTKPGPFTNKATLMRHVETQHVAPRSVPCLEENCDKLFSRKDNMMGHFRSVHGDGNTP